MALVLVALPVGHFVLVRPKSSRVWAVNLLTPCPFAFGLRPATSAFVALPQDSD
ncbi:hypothetical protein [Marivita geojedonensis]|uniref:hypothetical protein n=1 Tax=Marivita geojedonensis TaxID=1123756 RepID=UPI0013029251|nr:hypothetical protein [Marivita geojedonensis]